MNLSTFNKILNFSIVIFLFIGCLSLKPPPITFTQTQTAAERQMVGEDKDLEKDVWILSSIRTSASGSDVWDKEVLDREIPEKELDENTYIALRVIAYKAAEIRDFKKKGFIGESLDGNLKLNPQVNEVRFYQDFLKIKQNIAETIELINESRRILYNKRIEKIDKQLKEAQINKKKEQYLLTYYSSVEYGEYYESSKGKWSKKK